MTIIQANVGVPFDFCQNCEKLEIEETRFCSEGEVVHTTRTCRNESICEAAVKLSLKHQNDGWTPCDEKMPESDVIVLAAIKNYKWELPTDYKTDIEIAYWNHEEGWMWLAESGTDYWEQCDNVLAWMPLPDPFEGGEIE